MGEVANPHVVPYVPEPQPDYDAMQRAIVPLGPTILPMSAKTLADVLAFSDRIRAHTEPYPVFTEHYIHHGVYHRLVKLPVDCIFTGVLIKIPTTIIFSGDAMVRIEGGDARLTGFHIIPASAGRRMAFGAIKECCIDMSFATEGRTVEACERQFTDEYDRLRSHEDPARNKITITGDC